MNSRSPKLLIFLSAVVWSSAGVADICYDQIPIGLRTPIDGKVPSDIAVTIPGSKPPPLSMLMLSAKAIEAERESLFRYAQWVEECSNTDRKVVKEYADKVAATSNDSAAYGVLATLSNTLEQLGQVRLLSVVKLYQGEITYGEYAKRDAEYRIAFSQARVDAGMTLLKRADKRRELEEARAQAQNQVQTIRTEVVVQQEAMKQRGFSCRRIDIFTFCDPR